MRNEENNDEKQLLGLMLIALVLSCVVAKLKMAFGQYGQVCFVLADGDSCADTFGHMAFFNSPCSGVSCADQLVCAGHVEHFKDNWDFPISWTETAPVGTSGSHYNFRIEPLVCATSWNCFCYNLEEFVRYCETLDGTLLNWELETDYLEDEPCGP